MLDGAQFIFPGPGGLVLHCEGWAAQEYQQDRLRCEIDFHQCILGRRFFAGGMSCVELDHSKGD